MRANGTKIRDGSTDYLPPYDDAIRALRLLSDAVRDGDIRLIHAAAGYARDVLRRADSLASWKPRSKEDVCEAMMAQVSEALFLVGPKEQPRISLTMALGVLTTVASRLIGNTLSSEDEIRELSAFLADRVLDYSIEAYRSRE